MRAGQLRHKVSIQESTETSDGMGGFTVTWADISGMESVQASIWPLSAKESLDSMKLELQITHQIRIRYRDGITAKNRIAFGSRIFNIISLINHDERDISWDIMAIEET